MISSKQELIHSAWDVHQNHYSLKPIDFDVTFVSQMMANIFCPGPSYFYILDFNDRQFSYVSPTVKQTKHSFIVN